MRTTMKCSIKYAIAAIGIAAISACSGKSGTDAAQADFSRDLQLASSSVDLAAPKVDPSLLTLDEGKPNGTPAPARTLKKAPGDRVVKSRAPTVKSEPVTEVAAADEGDVSETIDEAPVPEPSMEPVAVAPRPTPVSMPGDGGDYGTGSNGGGVYGGGIGVVIRGGGVDGDNCEIPRRTPTRGPVFVPNTQTIPRGPGRVSGTRMPSSGVGGRAMPTMGTHGTPARRGNH